MRIAVLGPVEAQADDTTPVDVSAGRLRTLLARLALAGGRPVSAETLIDDLWDDDPPGGAGAALQGLVSRLRKVLGGAGSVELVAAGYRLPIGDGDVDARRFEELAAKGRRELAAGRCGEALALLDAALALWRGRALADVPAAFARNAATKLEQERLAAAEDRFEAKLRLGRHAEMLADLGATAAEHPLRERLAELLMRALAAAGRQSEALAAFEEIRARLGDELGVDPSSDLRATHLALLRGELDRPATVGAAAHANRLPARLTSFVGRKRELGQIGRLLADSRLVTVVGPGGAGKTRLALEAADREPRRVWFVQLAGVPGSASLAEAVLGILATTYGDAESGRSEPVARLAERLDAGDAVLVLDNCEHVVEAAAELAERLLTRLPQLRILATSREPLAITGETLCHLGPLELPSDEVVDTDAVRLFLDRATSVRPEFVLDGSTTPAVVEICRRLDGMPLALELAAARLRAMRVEEIARRLDDRFRLLTSGSRTALPRQRTLLAVVEWSWDLLGEPERVLARRLSAFPGGARLEALEAVCADGCLPSSDVVDVIGSLVEKSIVQQSGDRYQMLETIRAYAAARLAEAEEETPARFSAYFLALAEEHEPLLRTGDQLRAIALFDAEHDNLAFGLRAALDTADVPAATRFVRAMLWYWGLKGMTAQFSSSITEVLRFGEALPVQVHAAFSVALGVGGELRELGDDDAAPLTQTFHPALPMFHMARLARREDQERHLTEAMRSPDLWVKASTLIALDEIRVNQGDPWSGVEDRREALRLFEAVGDRWGMVMCLMRISSEHSLRGEHLESLAAAERAVVAAAELGTEMHQLWSRLRLARARMNCGDLEGALSDLHAALRQARERGHRRTETNLWAWVSIAHRLGGDVAEAEADLDRMEALAARLPSFEGLPSDAVAGFRMCNRLVLGQAQAARALLPQVVPPLFAQAQANGLGWGAELVAWLLRLEGDPAGAATWLGVSEVVRGALAQGDPEVRALVEALREDLGEDGYRKAFRLGAALTRQEALDRLSAEARR
ncbi:BTAD domain-containing putative transcriptional regulator [Nonomuraea soli]|uniref:Putative ATPase n=1 Tax=Nonomuraea soli TaxID=1032476 RepID=A0A7W0CFM7_9ACTN|nr:BTAD domain-containing putative transcriptional regulator [Nonomuraea soli]MBA2890253.1 putative ATPase [Nonomuraea soli]